MVDSEIMRIPAPSGGRYDKTKAGQDFKVKARQEIRDAYAELIGADMPRALGNPVYMGNCLVFTAKAKLDAICATSYLDRLGRFSCSDLNEMATGADRHRSTESAPDTSCVARSGHDPRVGLETAASEQLLSAAGQFSHCEALPEDLPAVKKAALVIQITVRRWLARPSQTTTATRLWRPRVFIHEPRPPAHQGEELSRMIRQHPSSANSAIETAT